MMRSLLCGTAVLVLLSATPVFADIQLSSLLTDNAVLQRGQPIPIRGSAAPDVPVSVTLGDDVLQTQSDSNGQWEVMFAARELQQDPLELTVQAGDEQITRSHLVMGDLWLCSGQSNMEWPLRQTDNAAAEIAAANFDQIRHFKVARSWSREAEEELVAGQWQLAVGEPSGDFTAVGYYFAKRIYNETSVPIGLIGSNWGGSRIEPWMSPEALGKPVAQTQAHIDELIATALANTKELRTRLATQWPGTEVASLDDLVATADWSAASLDTRAWETLQAPQLWEQQSFPEVDGVIWYRKTFELTAQEAAQPATLSLGAIDDNDTTWVNGEQVGRTEAYDALRVYPLPASLLRPGKNSIAVRVEDYGGGGGFHGDAAQLYVETESGARYSLAGEWRVKPDKLVVNELSNVNYVPTALYNKMIHPLFNTPIKGVIWYQGESNANNVGDAYAYEMLFQRMIKDWRARWNNPDMPFYWVQLANFNANNNSEQGKPWAILREAQTQALQLPHTGQAVIIDVGNPDDIHPRDKKTVGTRLANIALQDAYGSTGIHYRGPVMKSVKHAGKRVTVTFKSAEKLTTREASGKVQGFEWLDDQGNYYAVTGRLKGNRVILEVPADAEVAGVAYAWDDNPESANLMDVEGLPAEPFHKAL